MKPSCSAWLGPLISVVAVVPSVYASQFLSIEQAQTAMFPQASFTASPRVLSPVQIAEIQKASGQRVLSPQLKAWKVSSGGWFIVDQVLGKHEFITFAVGIDGAGAIKGVEILEYRESYGGEVASSSWRAQFLGKHANAPLKLGGDIQNISGATLSSKHVTDGVKRLLSTHALVLAASA